MSQFIYPAANRYEDVDLKWLVGRSVAEVSLHEPARWLFTFGPDASISVECLWRIIKSERIVLTCDDHGHQFGLPTPVDAVKKTPPRFLRVIAL